MNNQVISTIEARHSKRSYLKKDIPEEIIKKVLLAAGNAPSCKNIQPWQVAVVTGATLKKLSDAMCIKYKNNDFEKSDYVYMPDKFADVFLARARECGYSLFELKGVERNNREQRREHNLQNFLFFGAPMEIIFFLPKNSERGSFLDIGFFMQNIMLGLLSYGISSCPQFSLAEYPDTIREVLGTSKDLWVVASIACGYADDDKINTFIPPRLKLEEYTKFYH